MAKQFIDALVDNLNTGAGAPSDRAKLKKPVRYLAGRPLYAMTKAGVMGGTIAVSKSAGSGTTTSMTSRTRHKVPQGWSVSDIQVAYQNARLDSTAELDGENDISINSALEYASVAYQLSFRGGFPTMIKPGLNVLSDPGLGVQFPAGAIVYTRDYVSVVSGTYPLGRTASGNASEGTNGNNGADTSQSTGSMSTGGVPLFGPLAIIGIPSSPDARAGFIVGDSIPAGAGEVNGGDADGNFGWAERALSDKMGWATCTRSNYTFAYHAVSSRRSLAYGSAYATTSLCTLGINDVRAGVSLAVLQANALSLWTKLASSGAAVIQSTLTPNTSSTDGWTTTAGQTVVDGSQNTVRVNFNNWLRAGAPIVAGVAVAVGTSGALLAGQSGHPLYTYWDIADYFETSRDSGIYKVDPVARAVTDGAITTGTTTFTSATASFTSADVGTSIYIPGAGAAGAALVTQIRSLTNSTTVTLANAASTTVSGAAVKMGGITADGLHPATKGHAGCAVAQAANVDAMP